MMGRQWISTPTPLATGEHLNVGSVRAAAAVNKHLSKARYDTMKKPVRSKSVAAGKKPGGAKPAKVLVKRSWPVAVAWAGTFVGAAVILSAVVNPLFGRVVHWDWMAGLAPTLFVLLALSLRRRWV